LRAIIWLILAEIENAAVPRRGDGEDEMKRLVAGAK
jgi:hypothetical protein